jgi:hypothetical protein
MYSTCLFCNADLGANEVIEHFPVGRRLAFDAGKGRLWVVCRRCERWNLSPLEERWEAIEECEREFTGTRMRVSTDNIGLARLREGLELVRIGNPMRPEMAAWRYGDQFGRRRRNYLIMTGAGVAAFGGLVTLGAVTGVVAGGGWGLFQASRALVSAIQSRRVRAHIRLPGSDVVLPIRGRQLDNTKLAVDESGWTLRVDVSRRDRWIWDDLSTPLVFSGNDALVAAAKLLPAINSSGARASEVQAAVDVLGGAASADDVFARYAGAPHQLSRRRRSRRIAPDAIRNLPTPVRLALEMAAHEEQERRAMEGELAILEAAWKDAEEIARIADDLFVPEDVSARVAALKREG